jgi:type VI secretion system secreted protein Hcp
MAGNIFLQIEGVKGECTEKNHTDWIDVMSYTEGLHHSNSSGYGGGGGVGSAMYQDFVVNCQLEKAIPVLMYGCAGNKEYKKAKLHATKMEGTQSWNYLEITMEEVLVSSVQFSGSENQIPMVSIALSFKKIKTEYFLQGAGGAQGASTNAEWDQKLNK